MFTTMASLDNRVLDRWTHTKLALNWSDSVPHTLKPKTLNLLIVGPKLIVVVPLFIP